MGEITVTKHDGEIAKKSYEGDKDLWVVKRCDRDQLKDFKSTVNRLIKLFMMTLIGLVIGYLGFETLATVVLIIASIYLCHLYLDLIYMKIESIDTVSIKREGIKQGRVIEISEESLNNIVELNDGKVRRMYQLIEDKEILNLKIEDVDILKTEIPIGLKSNTIKHEVSVEDRYEDLSNKKKAVYNIGKTIPILSKRDIENVLNSIRKVLEHKITVENYEEYELEYNKLLENNKDLGIGKTKLLESKEYLTKELDNISKTLNKEISKSKTLGR